MDQADIKINKKIVALMVIATIGFGLWHGVRDLAVEIGPYNASPFALYGLLFDGATFLIVGFLSYWGRLDRAKPLFIAGLFASVIYIALVIFGNAFSDGVLFLKQASSGVALSLLMFCWIEVFTCYRTRYSAAIIVIAYGISVLTQLLTSTFIPQYRLIVLLLSFVVSVSLLVICLRENNFVVAEMSEPKAPRTTTKEMFSRTRRALVGVVVFSFIYGFVLQTDILAGLVYAQTAASGFFNVAVAIIAAIGFIVWKWKTNIDYVTPTAAIFLASILLYRGVGDGNNYLSGALMTMFIMFYYVLLWLMFIPEARQRKLPAFFLLGCALGLARISLMSGRFVANELPGLSGGVEPEMLLVLVWVLVVAVALLFYSYIRYAANKGLFNVEGVASVGEEDEQEARLDAPLLLDHLESADQDVRLQQLKKRYLLSNREFEMMHEFAQGRTARYIAEKYVLSEHTVKTHLRRVYEKTNVHSKQELINLIHEEDQNR